MGHLYRGIEQGFRRLVEKYAEHEDAFVGPPEAQATSRYFWWPELVPVTDLASAQAAIETIVEQGEGARAAEQPGEVSPGPGGVPRIQEAGSGLRGGEAGDGGMGEAAGRREAARPHAR